MKLTRLYLGFALAIVTRFAFAANAVPLEMTLRYTT